MNLWIVCFEFHIATDLSFKQNKEFVFVVFRTSFLHRIEKQLKLEFYKAFVSIVRGEARLSQYLS